METPLSGFWFSDVLRTAQLRWPGMAWFWLCWAIRGGRGRALALRAEPASRSHVGPIRKPTGPSAKDRILGGKAYASMAKVEGLKLGRDSVQRLERTKGLSPEKRRAEVLRAYGELKSKGK